MDVTVLELDLGERYREAIRFQRANPDVSLSDFLRAYPARFPKDHPPSHKALELPLSNFRFQPVHLKDKESSQCGERKQGGLRDELDDLWQQEQAGKLSRSPRQDEPDSYPETMTDSEAVRTAYSLEMKAIADFLKNGLSVLVSCDKMLTEYIYEYACAQAGKKMVLDAAQPQPDGQPQGMGSRLDQAMQGGQANPLAHLPILLHNIKANQVLVLRSLDMLDTPPMLEVLYQRSGQGEKPQLLGFLDPSLEAKKVLTDRFAVHVSIMGIPRYICLDGRQQSYTVTHLLTQKERACFRHYDPEGLYKNVSGLNAIQFRNAMQYVGAQVAPETDASEIYRVIRHFKTSSSGEIEIPDTTFENIGGYEHIKQQLKRIISLMAGPVRGLDEKQRGQLIPRGFVFHGPPGTGKTLFAKAIANELNATIQMVSGPEIMDKYVGQSETNLRHLFVVARRNAPAVIFFDEFDSIASQRSTYSDGGARANNAVVAQFLTELDGFRQDQTVLVIGTTNRIDIIDEALLRPSRLRPMEIGLPDYAARQRVAEIHAHNFGVDLLLKNLCTLALEHIEGWSGSDPRDDGRSVPQEFLDALFATNPSYQKRYAMEEQRSGFLRQLQEFFAFVHAGQQTASAASQNQILDQVQERIVKLGRQYGVDFEKETLPDLRSESAEAWLLPMRSDLRDLFGMLHDERQKEGGLNPDSLLDSVMDLVAEYTDQFNNDEIRAIFQEASLEHHLEGQLITPRYLGQKIGLIRKRRDEREAVHLSSQWGRR